MPVLRVSFGVEERKYNDASVFYEKEHYIWKAAQERPTDIFVDFGELLRFAENRMNSCIDGNQKLRSKSPQPVFIPVISFRQLCFGFGPYDQFALHARF